ncbi:BatD family protein [Microbulbifer hydrolyticus]|uniref:Protein BatD n=1 Tax=Microbulbifer hydrolyticus TaxID=48074 RepID=A0A6P1TBT4_9GAMM|nr:BatD family protein [Microbulbifer hydrolyticus]MBB5210851.1 hypothetical protein [Microbulbifer hydrolyticus]QHQ38719.1 hypothetical protein GTQ55_06760 [Microbulbifer hydrolyticus]
MSASLPPTIYPTLFLAFLLAWLLPAATVIAQTNPGQQPPAQSAAEPSAKPIVRTELSQTNIVPGQSVTLRITILVPTWLTKPVDLPAFDRPNLSVKLPERSTVSTSATINGSTWSGVVRDYQLVPLTPGTFVLPPTTLEVHYRNPDGANDIVHKAPLTAETLTVIPPKGAEKLQPYIAARELQLEQQVEGDPEQLRPGDSFSRTVIAKIQGSTVMFVPQLLDTGAPAGIAAYADTPKASDNGAGEREDGGVREEKITYVAESSTRGELPAIELQWYDLDDGSIQTSTVEAVKVRVKGAPLASRFSPTQLLLTAALLGVLGWVAWRCLPLLVARLHKRREARRRAGGADVLRQLKRAAKDRDYPTALAISIELETRPDYRGSDISKALLALGRAQYGDTAASVSADPLWQQLEQAVDAFATQNRVHRGRNALPPLNPRDAR